MAKIPQDCSDLRCTNIYTWHTVFTPFTRVTEIIRNILTKRRNHLARKRVWRRQKKSTFISEILFNADLGIGYYSGTWAVPAGWQLPPCALWPAPGYSPQSSWKKLYMPSRPFSSIVAAYIKIHEMCQKFKTLHSQCWISFYFRSLTA